MGPGGPGSPVSPFIPGVGASGEGVGLGAAGVIAAVC